MTRFIDLELIKAFFIFSLVLVFTGPSFSTQKKKKSKQLQSSKKSDAKYNWFICMLFIGAVIFFSKQIVLKNSYSRAGILKILALKISSIDMSL